MTTMIRLMTTAVCANTGTGSKGTVRARAGKLRRSGETATKSSRRLRAGKTRRRAGAAR